ncbi:MAG: hypothetical protein OEW88_06990, partial [Gammaproteobacteria bacterium]|nr:hypothetical protein [Gammaproteobacteria bacterium]
DNSSGPGGDAATEAHASGFGTVTASAYATGGRSDNYAGYGQATTLSMATTAGLGNVATGLAQSSGSSGTVEANSIASGGTVTSIRARASTTFSAELPESNSFALARTAVTVNGSTEIDSTALAAYGTTLATAIGLPDADVLDQILAVSPTVADGLAGPGVAALFAGAMGGSNPYYAVTGTRESRLFLTIDVGAESGFEFLLGLVNPVGLDDGFTSLHFQAFGDGTTLLDMSFTDLAMATAWFDDRLLNLGRLDGGPDGLVDLELSLDFMGTGGGDGFFFNVVGASAVPLPPSVWLMMTALGALVRRQLRRRARSSAFR